MKNSIIETGKKLVEEKMVARSWGNISARAGEKMIITPSGSNYEKLKENDLVEVDLKTGNFDAEKKPSSELEMHSKIYAYIKEANFIIHTHQKHVTAVSVLKGKDTSFEDDITHYHMAGTELLAEEVAKTFLKTGKQYVIVANHGAVAWGENCQEVMNILRELEDACREFIEGLKLESVADGFIPAYLEDFAMVAGKGVEVMDGIPLMDESRINDACVFEELAQKNMFVHQLATYFEAKGLDKNVIELMESKYINQYSKLYEDGGH